MFFTYTYPVYTKQYCYLKYLIARQLVLLSRLCLKIGN